MTTPIRLPVPPSTTMASTCADSMKVKLSGEMKPCRAAKKQPAKPPNMAPSAKARELGVGGVDAERAAGDLILAQRLPGAPDRQASQPHRDEGRQQRQAEDDVVEEDRAVDRAELQPEHGREALCPTALNGMPKKLGRGIDRDAGIAVREVDPVDQHEADDLAEGQRHDGEVVAAQAQHGEAEQDAPAAPRAGRRSAGRSRTPTRPSAGKAPGITLVASSA